MLTIWAGAITSLAPSERLTAIVSRVAAGDASSRSILMAFLAAANSDSVTLIERRAATTFSNAWKQREKKFIGILESYALERGLKAQAKSFIFAMVIILHTIFLEFLTLTLITTSHDCSFKHEIADLNFYLYYTDSTWTILWLWMLEHFCSM